MHPQIQLIPVCAGLMAKFIAAIANPPRPSAGPDHYTDGSTIYVHGPHGKSYPTPEAARQAAAKILQQLSK